MRRKREALCAVVFASAPLAVHAADVRVSDAWIRALPAGLPAAGYFVLHNAGAKDAALTGAQSPACGMLMLHRSTTLNGMSSMNEVLSVTVPAHGRLAFAPGG